MKTTKNFTPEVMKSRNTKIYNWLLCPRCKFFEVVIDTVLMLQCIVDKDIPERLIASDGVEVLRLCESWVHSGKRNPPKRRKNGTKHGKQKVVQEGPTQAEKI